MPHKVTNDSNSSLASGGSGDSTDSSDQVIVTKVPGRSIIIQPERTTPTLPTYRGSPRSGSKLTTPLPTVPAANPNTSSRRRRQPPVIIHNKGGQIYDETRPSDWDKQRWK
ncbi:hypothetical protein N7510_010932 [Penicillium lagena]|uniref:uncharacterized protein n=1 Tax=Penicillium lagena TaxID=94218 RepID=UPI0025420686|nr:uncharacterized protein N7510_010932 [Penicillium lagena]KAJ5601398.1 hypothetical protein N7510_010932 [Penicillium lagena]